MFSGKRSTDVNDICQIRRGLFDSVVRPSSKYRSHLELLIIESFEVLLMPDS